MQFPYRTGEQEINPRTPLLPAHINEISLIDPWSNWIKSAASVRHANRAEEWYIQCTFHGLATLSNCVEVDPERRGGVPVLKGTRVTVVEALGEIADSHCLQEIAHDFELDFENLKCLVDSLSLLFNRPYQK
jgi:uncharacterized protein (DUF433 family)